MIRSSSILFCVVLGVTLVVQDAAIAEEGPTQYSVSRLFGRNRTYAAEENSVEHGVVLLDFYNDACGPCRSMMPTVDRLVQRGFRISKVNTDKFPDWARRFNITQIPCFIVISDGKEIVRHTGTTSEQKLESMIVQAGGTPSFTPRTLKNDGEKPVQLAESAWQGCETPLSVQDIVEGRYVFPDDFETAPTATQVAANAQTAANAANSQNAATSANAANLTPVSAVPQGGSVWQPADLATVRPAAEAAATQSAASLAQSPSFSSAGAGISQTRARVLASTVRIQVADSSGQQGSGTGTLIDCRSGHALILTCGHLFREYKSGDSIVVDLFTANGTVRLPARYVNHDETRDLGLLSLTVQNPVEISPLAGVEYRLQRGMSITTSGCSEGADPTIQTGVITNLNRFMGTHNIEVSAVPVPGRSGGGLFTESGELIGVCFAANPDDQEGLFTSLDAIHEYFSSLKMEQFVQNPRNESSPAKLEEGSALSLSEISQNGPGSTVPVSVSGSDVTANSGLKSAEPSVVSLANVDTVTPIVPQDARPAMVQTTSAVGVSGNMSSGRDSGAGSVSVESRPSRSLTGDVAPSWPPSWN